jgi:pimeloyl-ACP methyl ester carboxylesterase
MTTCGRPRRIQVNGLDLRLHEWGSEGAPGVLLLHSLAAHGHWWDWVAERLEARHHVIALDLRGHGGSEWAAAGDGAQGYTFDDYVDDVARTIELLGWPSPLVMGHSLGGYLAAQLAATRPARVGAVVIADIMTGFSDEMAARAARQAERPGPEFASPAEAGARFRLAPPETVAPADALHHLGASGVVERAPAVWHHAFDRRVFLHPRPDPWPFLSRIACPVLVVRGDGSTVMTREAAERVAHAVPHGSLAELPGTFHHLIVDDPAGFVARVEAWYDGVHGGAER